MSDRSHIVVIGGGITGLACAHALAQSRGQGGRARVTLLETGERLGGKIRSESIEGRRIDVGAESLFVRTPAAIELCRELDLDRDLVTPSTMAISVWARRRLRELAPGILGGLPDGARPVLRSGILSPRGVARASLDLVLPRFRAERDRSVAELIGGRLGAQALDRLVEPLLGTIYAAGCDTLSLRATAPQFETIAREHRSLIRGMLAARPRPQTGPLFATLAHGLERLVERLGERLEQSGDVEIRRRARARLLLRAPEGSYAVVLADNERIEADGIVIATPAYEAASILGTLALSAARELAAIGYRSTVLATLGYPGGTASRALSGSGFLVPHREQAMLGACTVLSNKWPHLAEDGELWLRCSVARANVDQALAMDDSQLLERLTADLRRIAGLDVAPSSAHITRWSDALPHYEPGHLDRVERIERHLERFPRVVLAGAAYRGMGVPQCIAQGRAAAGRVLAALNSQAVSERSTDFGAIWTKSP